MHRIGMIAHPSMLATITRDGDPRRARVGALAVRVPEATGAHPVRWAGAESENPPPVWPAGSANCGPFGSGIAPCPSAPLGPETTSHTLLTVYKYTNGREVGT